MIFILLEYIINYFSTLNDAVMMMNFVSFPSFSICKGPPERPGIFVQSTKSNGVAREAGLRPGDQVLACNGHSFLHIPFAEVRKILSNLLKY